MSIISRVIPLVLFLFVYIIGLIGNGLLIFIVFRQKTLQTVPNLLVVSLALGDFLFVLFCVPFGAVAYSLEYYPFSTFYCRFENFIINLSLGVSVFSLLALSADRYKIIVKPFSSHANDPSIKLKTIVISIWFLSIILALPETIYSGLVKETVVQPNNRTIEYIYCLSPNNRYLLENPLFMITRQITRLVIYYIMPLVFVSVFYILIAKHLFQTKSVILKPLVTQTFVSEVNNSKRGQNNNNSNKQRSNTNQEKNSSRSALFDGEKSNLMLSISTSPIANHTRRKRDCHFGNPSINNNNNSSNLVIHTLYQDVKTRKQLRARHKVAKTVLFLCIVFFICWLPKQIHDLYMFIGVILYSASWNHFWQLNKTLALVLSYTYSCINPFALYFLSSTFRHFYKRYLFFWTNTTWLCCSKKHQNNHIERRRTGETVTVSESIRRSSTNNTTSVYYDLNRIKTPMSYQRTQNSRRTQRNLASDGTSTESGTQLHEIAHLSAGNIN